MEFKNMYIEELIDVREQARKSKNFDLSDSIRDYLDTKQVFIFDTKNGQEVHHYPKGMTRDRLILKIEREKELNELFDSWLLSMNASVEVKKERNKDYRVILNGKYFVKAKNSWLSDVNGTMKESESFDYTFGYELEEDAYKLIDKLNTL